MQQRQFSLPAAPYVQPHGEMLAFACSGLDELRWHQGMLQRWPAALCSAYALAILLTAGRWLHSLQQTALASPGDTTVQQLCQSLGNAAHLMDLASSVHQKSTQMQQSAEVQSLVLPSVCSDVFKCQAKGFLFDRKSWV